MSAQLIVIAKYGSTMSNTTRTKLSRAIHIKRLPKNIISNTSATCHVYIEA